MRHPTRRFMRSIFLAAAAMAGIAAAIASAQTPAPAATAVPADAPTLDTVLVTGEQPGPGLWKVSKDDHVLWILGTWSPLPRGMTWRSTQAEELIAQSQEVLTTPRPNIEIGFFHRLTLLPSLIGVRNNPDRAKLKDVLPPDLYARWQTLKERYIGNDKGVESQRPMFAARELYSKALGKSGLTLKNDAQSLVEELAKKDKVKLTEIKVGIEVDEPRQLIRDFKNTPRDADIACLRATMDRLETDLETMKHRANAWASGDLEGLRNLPYNDQTESCITAIASSPNLRGRVEAARTQVAEAWGKAVEAALARNASTFVVAPMGELTRDGGWLAALRAKGYTVEAPE
jgi:uncharacterized protein YbaP (TraB family)